MRVLITGASGFVGKNLINYLLENTDWSLVGMVSSMPKKNSDIQKINNRRFVIFIHDLKNPIPNIGAFDYIIHLASESHVDSSIKNPKEFIGNNVATTLSVLEYARLTPLKKFLLFSTEEVYGVINHKLWDIMLPANPYAASKASQEMIGLAYWRTYGVPLMIVNSNNIVGPFQDKEKFVPKIAGLIKEGKPVTIYMNKGKAGKRYWIPIKNVCDSIKFILNKVKVDSYPDFNMPVRENLTGGTVMDNLQMAGLVAEVIGKSLDVDFVEAETIRKGYDEFHSESKRKNDIEEMGWKPVQTLKEALSWI